MSHLSSRRTLVLACSVLFGSATHLHAQRLRGQVRSTLGTPIAGAVITVLDAARTTTRQALSDAEGRYTVELPASAREVRVIHIGYRPVNQPVPAGDGDRQLDIRMEPLPPRLATINVQASTTCRDASDAATILSIWEQARAALVASVVAAQADPPVVTTMRYELRADPDGTVRQLRMTTTTALDRRFETGSPEEELFTAGYRRREDARDVFIGPDAKVLTGEYFLRAHCLTLRTGTGTRAGQVGLQFTPRVDLVKSDRVDIAGTVWLDAAISKLIDIEYQYTSLTNRPAGTGGWIEFETLPSGVVFVQAWRIFLPEVVQPVRGTAAAVLGTVTSTIIMNETGGFVLNATWPDSTTWRGRVGAVAGRVTDAGSHAPVAGAEVLLDHVGSAWSDDRGRYVFPALPPGRYDIHIIDSTWTYLVPPRIMRTREVGVARDTAVMDFEVPSHESLITTLCKGKSLKPPVLFGTVTDGTVERPIRMSVHVSSSTWGMTAPVDPMGPVGHFYMCGAPDGGRVTATLQYEGIPVADTTFDLPKSSELVRNFPWSLSHAVFAPARGGDWGVLAGRLVDNGTPRPGVLVRLAPSGDTVSTRADGSFRFVGLSAQTYSVGFSVEGAVLGADTVTIAKKREVAREFVVRHP